jgi:hypothetical protein
MVYEVGEDPRAVIWYSPLMVSPATVVAPEKVTKSPFMYPSAESETVTVVVVPVLVAVLVVNGFAPKVRVTRRGVTS